MKKQTELSSSQVVVKEVQRNYISLVNTENPTKVPGDIIKAAINVSATANQKPYLEAMTPWFKNMLKEHDGRDKASNPLKVGDPITKAEVAVNEWVESLLIKYNKDGQNRKYTGLRADLVAKRNYDVDCWVNFKTSWRQQALDGLEQVTERSHLFTGRTDSKPSMKYFIDPLMNLAIRVVMEGIPEFVSTTDIVDINTAFMTKHTNVGAPYFRNDKAIVPGTTKTYADLCLEDAKKITGLSDIQNLRVAALFSRFTNGKGRAIMGTSRIANMYFNQVLGPAIVACKNLSPWMLGYNDKEFIRSRMITLHDMRQPGDRKSVV